MKKSREEIIRCAVCENEIKDSMEVEYSAYLNEFFCSPDCATERYFGYLSSFCVDLEAEIPEGAEINKDHVLVKRVSCAYGETTAEAA